MYISTIYNIIKRSNYIYYLHNALEILECFHFSFLAKNDIVWVVEPKPASYCNFAVLLYKCGVGFLLIRQMVAENKT